MRRAYVGLSSPFSYDYRNDVLSAEGNLPVAPDGPSPVIIGGMGLILLYDEVWFFSRELCPQKMRGLPYVRFLVEERKDLDLGALSARVKEIDWQDYPDVSLNDVHPDGFGALNETYYGSAHPDNHGRSHTFKDQSFTGNSDYRSFLLDLCVVDLVADLKLIPVFNPLTRRFLFPDDLAYLSNHAASPANMVPERMLLKSSIYEITGAGGPYHPVLEELRGHDFIETFRRWTDREVTRLDNNEVKEVMTELQARSHEFARTALSDAVGKDKLKETAISFVEGILLDALPGAHTVAQINKTVKAYSEAEDQRLYAFVAESQGRLLGLKSPAWDAYL